MGREIENIRSCDVIIFAGGRSGTLGEFAIAYDEAKVIGVLEGTGGITEHLKIKGFAGLWIPSDTRQEVCSISFQGQTMALIPRISLPTINFCI
jgi:hypothetical protein